MPAASARPAASNNGASKNGANKNAANENNGFGAIGFGPMTRVTTSFGEVPAQALRVRDMVRTRNGSFARIEWIDRIYLDTEYLAYHPEAQPIMIKKGALALNYPCADVMFAPFQRISARQTFVGTTPDRVFDALNRPNVHRKSEQAITYTVFHCGAPTSVKCEGIWIDVAPPLVSKASELAPVAVPAGLRQIPPPMRRHA